MIHNDLKPENVLCVLSPAQIDELVAVPVTDEELSTVDAKGRFVQDETRKPLCLACVWARPCSVACARSHLSTLKRSCTSSRVASISQ